MGDPLGRFLYVPADAAFDVYVVNPESSGFRIASVTRSYTLPSSQFLLTTLARAARRSIPVLGLSIAQTG